MIVADNLQKHFMVGVRGENTSLWKHFFAREKKRVDAVRGVTFEVAAGEIVGFLGANGAGKTTTLKMLAGLLLPTGGTARVCGHDPFARDAAFLRQIALVMGNKQQLLWDVPPTETFRLNAAIYGVDDKTLKQRSGELISLLGLESKLTQPVRKLSLGERMKCELVASLLHAPKVLFLDEPTLGLDVNAQESMRGFLRDYNARTGATIILTSHYMQDIEALAKRVIVVHDGTVAHDGTLDELSMRFGKTKEIRLRLATPAAIATLRAGVDVTVDVDADDSAVIVVRVDAARATAVLQMLLAATPVLDVEVKDPPIEHVIAQIFRGAA
jgi:ABC-2 type transport system ATP-binding protein